MDPDYSMMSDRTIQVNILHSLRRLIELAEEAKKFSADLAQEFHNEQHDRS